MTKNKEIGRARRRIEGELKVTGQAKYAAEYNVPDLLHGYIVNATIVKGKIESIDEAATRAVPGVVDIIHHENRPKMAYFDMQYSDMDAPPGSPFRPLYDAEIKFHGQPIALVVAKTFEAARYAASLLKITYTEEEFDVNLKTNLDRAKKPSMGLATLIKPLPPGPRGDFDAAYATATAKFEGEFHHGAQHHNPMEMFASTTVYEGEGKLTIYDKTQGTNNSQLFIGNIFGLKMGNVRVIAPYVGGGFGSGLRPQHQLVLSVLAALCLKRNVRVSMDRSQMFTYGHRPETIQHTRFGATADGELTAVNHVAHSETSRYEDYNEVVVNHAGMLYPAQNVTLDYKLVPLDVSTPMDMRAPGGVTGMVAVENTMDQVADRLGMDPLEFRLKNYAERDHSSDKPFSSKELRECYRQGAESFGWKDRRPTGQPEKRGNRIVGRGMSSGLWDVIALPGKATAEFNAEGKLVVSSAVNDCGQGAYTVFSQIAADQLGLPLESVKFVYGDSELPLSPIQGGSYTTGVVGSAVKLACLALRNKLFKLAQILDGFPLGDALPQDVDFMDGEIIVKKDPTIRVKLTDVVAFNQGKPVKASKSNIPNVFKLKQYTRAAHAASFVEVEIDEQLGIVNVTRAVTAVAAGAIMNPKTARSQILGGMVWGISLATREESLLDKKMGKYVNDDLGEYHLPVHADIHDLEVIFVEEHDEIINALGAKGIGEIGMISMAPAIINAVYNATGKLVTALPLKVGDLL
ncbi:xanthine dehydrogenase family protein molybdopterin-binding subunit [Neolewinella antarctica]|uniref:Xanthine dehydrogenase YagR molybdenum-binding subunit n=1 Tax=Neolewinella antarctica TaxID=442734 RepID=A0ABX0XHJ1_9BACT|nr:xanthine dehydrogenase family protein molybdopterin-binding subunit [Neolewinella antarctica]NJC28354.1 xanthine dehydrogenase YagR molybdenum-binding subunit [Neolewinella antarctica]